MVFAVCCLEKRVSPLINHSNTLCIVSYAGKKRPVVKELHISHLTPSMLIDILNGENVKVLICGGIQEEYRKALTDNNIKYLENIIGGIQEVIKAYLNGNLCSNSILDD